MTIDDRAYRSLHTVPEIEGPIPVSAESVPFCAMQNSRRPVDLRKFGYVEEEFFVAGNANVYQETDGGLGIVHEAVPYRTRLIVRKPADSSEFSGRVYFDILNATQNYDIEDLWHRIYLWCMEQGHGYVGITSKPVNVRSLKQYDHARYRSLNWASPKTASQPATCINGEILGTEEGMIWDMIGQTATAIRSGKAGALFGGEEVCYLCLTGQSQSGFYLNTFIAHFDRYMADAAGRRLFDGYMNIVGVPFERELRQGISKSRFSLKPRRDLTSGVPLIMISSEGDIELFSKREGWAQTKPPLDCDTRENKCRYYEVAGAPHTDVDCGILSGDAEIIRAGYAPMSVDSALRSVINDFPLAEYVCGFLEKLYVWRTEGVAPATCRRFERNPNGELRRDARQNVCGGFRTPYVDLPVASYQGTGAFPIGDIAGRRNELYESEAEEAFDRRLLQLEEALNAQLAEGWLTEGAVSRMLQTERNRHERLQNAQTDCGSSSAGADKLAR